MHRFEKTKFNREEVPKFIKELNKIYDEVFEWRHRKARKVHIDLFGKMIHPDEYYWRMRMGGSYENDLKLSEETMERFVYILFAPDPYWEGLEIEEKKEKITDKREIIKRLDDYRSSVRERKKWP